MGPHLCISALLCSPRAAKVSALEILGYSPSIKLLPKSAKRIRWVYEYDFGDGWRHEILFEGFPPIDPKTKAPLCLEGGRACPPEDCGGPPGYEDYLAAVADPQHEQHEELLEWRGPFDPEAFDAKKVTREIRKVK